MPEVCTQNNIIIMCLSPHSWMKFVNHRLHQVNKFYKCVLEFSTYASFRQQTLIKIVCVSLCLVNCDTHITHFLYGVCFSHQRIFHRVIVSFALSSGTNIFYEWFIESRKDSDGCLLELLQFKARLPYIKWNLPVIFVFEWVFCLYLSLFLSPIRNKDLPKN